MINTLFAIAPGSAFGVFQALGPDNPSAFGVGKAFAALFVASAFLLGAMFLGGHLGEGSRRRRDKRREKRR